MKRLEYNRTGICHDICKIKKKVYITMDKLQEFLKRKNIIISGKRYGIDALGAMAQGLFCSLLIGTIIKTLGEQAGISFLVDVGN